MEWRSGENQQLSHEFQPVNKLLAATMPHEQRKEIITRQSSNSKIAGTKETRPDDNITTAQLLKILQDNINERFDQIENKIDSRYDQLEQKINNVATTTEKQETALSEMQNVIQQLQTTIVSQDAELSDLRREMNRKIDRDMRETLIIKHIPQSNSEKTWKMTEEVLVESIVKHCPVLKKNEVRDTIDRCHRDSYDNRLINADGEETRNDRPIFVKFKTWTEAEKVKNCVIAENKRRRKTGKKPLHISEMFSKQTTMNRNEALKARKELMLENDNMVYRVIYPAKLMGKEKNSDDKFRLIKEFV